MASVKLTQSLRDEILGNALKGAFETEKKALHLRRCAVGDAVYRLLVTEEIEKTMKKLPTGFLYTSNEFHFTPYDNAISMGRNDGARKSFPLSADRRLPKFFETYTLPVFVGLELSKEIAATEVESSRLIESKRNLSRSISAILNSVGTVTRLLVAWPEVEKFLPDYVTNPKLLNLPAVQVAELNAMLMAAKQEESES